MNRTARVMIARDEARCIERCLCSAAPHAMDLEPDGDLATARHLADAGQDLTP